MLPRCLKSVQDVASELVVVDTGSVDDTMGVAKDFGAKIFHFKWSEDFAAARNKSLRHATGDWILQIDADEELVASSISPLKEAMLNPWCLLYVVSCDNGVGSLQRFFQIGRLFRNHPLIQYRWPYHELVYSSVNSLMATEPRWHMKYEPKIIVRHYGYEPSHMKERNKDARALRIMESHIEKNPHDGYILTKLGLLYSRLKRYDKAAGAFEQAIAINVNDPDAHFGLGAIYVQRGMVDEAIVEYKKALVINPDLLEVHTNLGVAYAMKDMLDAAIAEFGKSLAINAHCAEAHGNLGECYRRKEMLDEAISEFRRALAICPNYAMAHNGLAVAYYGIKEYALAIKHCDRAIKLGHQVHPTFLQALQPYR